ncbi:MAG: DUF4157 domain-containing protein [Panacibacter sp.]
MIVFIKENSVIARAAAIILRSDSMAIVIGNTIYLWNTEKSKFLENNRWLRHELTHIAQFKRYGFTRFVFLYIFETIKKGYHKNRFEKEAREKENIVEPLTDFYFS